MIKVPSKDAIIGEIIYIVTTTATFVGIDGMAQIMRLYEGDLSLDAFKALGIVILGSIVKAILIQVYPWLKTKDGLESVSLSKKDTP